MSRYGFPKPARDHLGERLYGGGEVLKLRLMKRLLDRGHRPGKIIELTHTELEDLAALDAAGQVSRSARRARGRTADGARPTNAVPEDLRPYLELAKAHQIEELRAKVSQAALRLGLVDFVGTLVAALNERIGEAWTRGELEIADEHLYTEAIQSVLRNAIASIAMARRRPNVLLSTFPQEPHGLGLLMADDPRAGGLPLRFVWRADAGMGHRRGGRRRRHRHRRPVVHRDAAPQCRARRPRATARQAAGKDRHLGGRPVPRAAPAQAIRGADLRNPRGARTCAGAVAGSARDGGVAPGLELDRGSAAGRCRCARLPCRRALAAEIPDNADRV